MKYKLSAIADILEYNGHIVSPELMIDHLLTDSRRIHRSKGGLFFALRGKNHDGHKHITEAYANGVRAFVAEKVIEGCDDADFLIVTDSKAALQRLAAYHRSQFKIPVIGITGSNGKTIVKDWIYHFLKAQYNICRSPKSYNSQLGVPLSVVELNDLHELGMFEAGISTVGEMENLVPIIQPEVGVFTHLGTAHDEGFASEMEKIQEKIKLFQNCKSVIYRSDNPVVNAQMDLLKCRKITWTLNGEVDAIWKVAHKNGAITLNSNGEQIVFKIPFIDDASLENAVNAFLASVEVGGDIEKMIALAETLPQIQMRLELLNGINRCRIINDVYSSDLDSLTIALHFMKRHFDVTDKDEQRRIILSDIDLSGPYVDESYRKVAELINSSGVNKLTCIGSELSKRRDLFKGMELTFYPDTDSWIECFNQSHYKDEIILLKGARKFSMERLTQKLAGRQHNTVLEINLSSMAHNLNVYKELLQPDVKVMVMVKAFGYGSGAAEIAHTLVFNRIDYLAVAYIDEGIELRKQGVHIPIMVMNPDPMLASELMSFKLEPTLFSLEEFQNLKRNGFRGRVHIKLDTGMNRLGFKEEQIKDLISEFSGSTEIEVGSIFSHLSSADLPEQDTFSGQQIQNFNTWSNYIISQLGYPVLKHLLNSPGIARFPNAQFDMVRLGIGLYGDDPSSELKKKLVPVSSLITTVAQVKEVKAGESISYGRTYIAEKDMKIAVLNIGYADGFRRSLSNGKGRVAINGKIVPVIGRICMDMCIVDVSELEGISAGDKAEIFGEKITLRTLAKQLETIPYEVLTGISQRVRRIYTEE